MPEGASTLAPHVDALYYDIFWMSVVFFVGIVGAMVWFAFRFRRRRGVKSKQPGHHVALEIFWTFTPLLLLGYMFHQGFEGFMMMATPPATSINVRVRASQWRWEFEQPNGQIDGELFVPEHRPVRMIMSSVPRSAAPSDGAVLHSFFVPAFRVKRDVVPGMYTSLWFEATRQGDYQIYCSEYCGEGHSRMLSTVHVLTQQAYDEYLSGGAACPDEFQEDWQWGQQLFTNNGCVACHAVEPGASPTVGPNLSGVAGTTQPLEGGGEAMADAEYLRRSLTNPSDDIVRGFTGAAMPPFNMSQRSMDALVSYVAHLSPAAGSSMAVSQHCGGAAAGGE